MPNKKSGFLTEFKKFISKGNVMDMAIGVIMGAAFTAIINSMVKDILMPIISLVVGRINFIDLKWIIKPATETTAETAISYGNFIQAAINFLLIALCMFILMKQFNKIRETTETKKKTEEVAKTAPAPDPNTELLTEIRNLLKENRNI
ncbi:MAG: large-conductance mechanosensitive channel protein MscL [Sphaerochaetaceae bacterium]